MSWTIRTTALQNKAAALIDSVTDAGINLREHLKDPASFGKLLDDQSQDIATLNESIERAKVTLPDGTGREVYAWEYEALEKLAKDNQKEIAYLLQRIGIKSESIVYANWPHALLNDISSLSELKNLRTLTVSSNQIRDISAVAMLTNLQELYIYGQQIRDISSLSGLINLQKLFLNGNKIQKISAVSGLTNLQELHLAENEIQDISALAALTKLQTLALYDNQIQDISALADLTNLAWLYLSHNQIENISAVSGLTNLRELALSNNPIQKSQRKIIQAIKQRDVRVHG